MTLLPVVERELRVGARNRATYRLRFLAPLIPTLFSIFGLWFVPTFFNEGPIPPRDLFLILTWMAFVFIAIAGFALTCDTISLEKRDATLGLLFLTDLKGYDIVLGKLAVAALRGVSSFVGTIPVLALPLMLGGTDLAEFSRISLTILLTLFFSMTVGLLASATMRRAWTAFGTSAFVLLVFCLGLPLHSEFIRAYYRDFNLAHLLELPSPAYALLMSFRTAVGLSGFAPSLAIFTTLAFIALIITSIVTPHVWKDRPPARRLASLLQWARELKFGAGRARDQFRRRLLDFNPVYWLSRRERVSCFGLLLIILAIGATAGWFASRDLFPRGGWQALVIVPFIAWTAAGAIIHVVILLRLAVIAAERFGEDRKSGALELTLSTPITVKKVLAGHWLALCRYFAGPALIAFGIQVLAIFLFLNVPTLDNRNPATVGQLLGEVVDHLFVAPYPQTDPIFHIVLLIGLGLFPVLALNWVALAWLSTWFSLRTKAAITAPIAAVILLHAPPWLLFGLIATIIEENRFAPSNNLSAAILYYFLGATIIVTHQLLCLLWSRRRLHKHFRTAATDRYQPHLARRPWWKRLAIRRSRPQTTPPVLSAAQ
jgi:ABC-type transport system involved in multi-copper enzyme maturation permease subunit